MPQIVGGAAMRRASRSSKLVHGPWASVGVLLAATAEGRADALGELFRRSPATAYIALQSLLAAGEDEVAMLSFLRRAADVAYTPPVSAPAPHMTPASTLPGVEGRPFGGGPDETVVTGVALPAMPPTDLGHEPIIISIRGDLNARSVEPFRATLREAGGAQLVVLDLSDVGCVDMAGIGVLIGGIRTIHAHGGRAVVVTQPGPVFGLLDRLGIGRLTTVRTTVDDATRISSTPIDVAVRDGLLPLLGLEEVCMIAPTTTPPDGGGRVG